MLARLNLKPDDAILKAARDARAERLRLASLGGRLTVQPALSWEVIARRVVNGLRGVRNALSAWQSRSDVERAAEYARALLRQAEEDFARVAGGEDTLVVDARQYRALIEIYLAAYQLARDHDDATLARLQIRVDRYGALIGEPAHP